MGSTAHTVRDTFIHVFGKPVENPPSGCSVKELHGATKNPSEELIMESRGCSESSLTMQKTSQRYERMFAFLSLLLAWAPKHSAYFLSPTIRFFSTHSVLPTSGRKLLIWEEV